jgi:hypothetical protein
MILQGILRRSEQDTNHGGAGHAAENPPRRTRLGDATWGLGWFGKVSEEGERDSEKVPRTFCPRLEAKQTCISSFASESCVKKKPTFALGSTLSISAANLPSAWLARVEV